MTAPSELPPQKASGIESPHATGYLAYALGVCYAAMVSLAIATNFMPVFLTSLETDLGNLTQEQLGRVAGITFAGLVLGILVTGPIADRVGAKSSAVAGNVLIAIGLLATNLSPGYDELLLSVFCMGLGAGVLDMVLSPIVAALQPHNRNAALNWLHSFYCVGSVLAVLAGAGSLYLGVSWRTLALLLLPLPALVGIAFALLRLPPLVPENEERTSLGHLLGRGVFLAALAAIFLAGATELGLAQWLPAYAEKTLGYSKEVAALALMAFSVTMTLGRMVVGVVAGRYSATTLMLAGCWSSAALFVVACFAPWPWLALTGCIAVGFTGSALWPSMLAVTADWYPRGGATMFGVLAALGNAGGIFMPWGVGAIADETSMPLGLFSAAFCPLLMIVCLLWMKRRVRTVGP